MDLYFFDHAAVREMDSLVRVPAPVEKLGPALEPAPWDTHHVASFAGSIVPLADGRLRMYYTRHGKGGAGGLGIGVAESEDGVRWSRPPLGQVEWNGADTNLLRIEGLPDELVAGGCGQPQVLRRRDGRWMMYFWTHGKLFRYLIAWSDDGLRWRVRDLDRPAIYHVSELRSQVFSFGFDPEAAAGREPFADLPPGELARRKRLRSNDAVYVYYDEPTDSFEMYAVWLMHNPPDTPRHVPFDNAPLALRTISRRSSDDGLEWSDPELIITPDDADPVTQQFYYLAVHRQHGWRVGMLGSYPVAEQTMDIELCFSRDGSSWDRPLRVPWIPRGPDEYDSLMILAPDQLVDHGDRWLLLYTATNYLHNSGQPEGYGPPRSVVAAARFPKRRFLGLRAGDSARLWTRPFILQNPEIRLDAAVEGTVRAALCDPFGRPLDGFGFEQSEPLSGDLTDHVLRWKNENPARYRYDALSLRLDLSRATLFALVI